MVSAPSAMPIGIAGGSVLQKRRCGTPRRRRGGGWLVQEVSIPGSPWPGRRRPIRRKRGWWGRAHQREEEARPKHRRALPSVSAEAGPLQFGIPSGHAGGARRGGHQNFAALGGSQRVGAGRVPGVSTSLWVPTHNDPERESVVRQLTSLAAGRALLKAWVSSRLHVLRGARWCSRGVVVWVRPRCPRGHSAALRIKGRPWPWRRTQSLWVSFPRWHEKFPCRYLSPLHLHRSR